MKAIIEFNLNEMEEENKLKNFLQLDEYNDFFYRFESYLKGKLKYSNLTNEQFDVFQEVFDEFVDLSEEINFYE